MKKTGLLLLIMLGVLLSVNTSTAQSKKTEVKVMYFHGPMRCHGCIVIENETKATMEGVFDKEIKSGKVKFDIIDFHKEENEHYIDKYKLETQTLIIAKFVDGKQTEWKNLDKIWKYGGDSNKFKRYVSSEIKKLLK